MRLDIRNIRLDQRKRAGVYPILAGGGGSSPWTPADILANIVGWYDASDASTITETAGAVSQIDDKGLGGYDLTAVSNKPEWGLGAQIGGMNVLHFAATLSLIENTSASVDCTEVAIVSVNQPTAAGDYPNCGTIHKADDSDKLDLRMQMAGSGLIGRIAGNITIDSTVTSPTSLQTDALQDDVPFIVSGWYDGLIGRMRVDGGTLDETTDPPDGATFTVNHIKMGRESNTPKNYTGEMIVLDTANINTIELCEGYLAWKWSAAL